MQTQFDTIESAQEFLALLREAVEEAKGNADADIATEVASARRVDALRLVTFKLEKLDQHVRASCRLLNDLRTLRRLLLEERSEPAVERREVQTVPAKVQPVVEIPKSSTPARVRAIAI